MVDRDPSLHDQLSRAVQRLHKISEVAGTAEEIFQQNQALKPDNLTNRISTLIERNYLDYYLSNIQKVADPVFGMGQKEHTVSLHDESPSRRNITLQLKGRYRLSDERIGEMIDQAKAHVALTTLEAFSGPVPLVLYPRRLMSIVSGQKIDPVLLVSIQLPTAVEGTFIEYTYPLTGDTNPQVAVIFQPL